MATTLPYNFAHCWDEMYKGCDEQGPYYEVKYVFDNWADSDAVVNALKGVTVRTGGVTTRNPPHQHPLSPNLYCMSARVEGIGRPVRNPQGYPGYDGGFFVRATYRAPLIEGVINPADDPFGAQQIDPATPLLWCTQELDFDTETIIVPNTQFKWASDMTASTVPLKVTVGLSTLRLTYHRVPFTPTAQMRAYRGRVNNAAFLGGAVGCVLFKGGQTRREYATDGTVTRQVTLVFLERDRPWTQTLRRDTATLTWDSIVDSTGAKAYQSANLSNLLTAFA